VIKLDYEMNKVEKLNGILSAFKIAAVCKDYSEYKSSCFYDIELAPGTKIKDIEKFSAELSLALKKAGKPRVLLRRHRCRGQFRRDLSIGGLFLRLGPNQRTRGRGSFRGFEIP